MLRSRKALQVLIYLVQVNTSDSRVAVELGFLGLLLKLASSEDADVREAALGALMEILRNCPASSIPSDAKEQCKKMFCSRDESNDFPLGDFATSEEERHLLDALKELCRGERTTPPGEDAPR